MVACGIFSCGVWDLAPWPGMEPGSPVLRVPSLSHWTTRDAPVLILQMLSLPVPGRSMEWALFKCPRNQETPRGTLDPRLVIPKLQPPAHPLPHPHTHLALGQLPALFCNSEAQHTAWHDGSGLSWWMDGWVAQEWEHEQREEAPGIWCCLASNDKNNQSRSPGTCTGWKSSSHYWQQRGTAVQLTLSLPA